MNKHSVALYVALLFRTGIFLIISMVGTSIAHAMEAPRDVRGTVVRPTVIKWEWRQEPNATRYQVNVNGAFVAMTNNNYYYSRNLSTGNYTVTVQSVDNNGRYSSPSKKSDVRSIGNGSSSAVNNDNNNRGNASSNLRAPRDPRGTVVRAGQIKWEWARVNGAEQYEVFVNNNPVGLTTDLYVYSRNLSGGEYSMKVRSVDSNGGRSADSAIARQTIGGGSGSNNNASNNNASNGLPAPRDPRGTRVRPAEIKWEWAQVSGASEYEVTVNGQVQRSSTLYLYTKNLPAGEHTMTVRALTSDGRKSSPSNQAKASTSHTGNGGSNNDNNNQATNASVGVPTDVRGTVVGEQEVKWEWATVPGATGYKVYLDGSSAGTTQNDYLYTPNLSGGNHSVKVAAIDSQGRQSAQSAEATVNISGNVTDAGGVAPPPPENDNGLIDPESWNYREVSQKAGYELVFSDEFNSNRLNPARWNTQLRWDGSHNGDRYEYRLINGEAQFYVNTYSKDQEHLDKVASVFNPFEFDGNRLAIRSIKNPLRDRNTNLAYGPLRDIAPQQPFLSGAITTYDKFSQKYGYFEARIKIPSHLGTFPAFWLHHQKRESEGTQKTEIDIMENLGHAPWYVYNSFHYYTGVSEGVGGTAHSIKPSPQGQIHTGTDYSQDYHVYAAEWKPGHIRFLIDGQQVSEVRNGASDHEELYMILNMAVGGIWTNMRTNAGGTGRPADNRFPNQQDIDQWGNPALEIDYVRAYKRL